MMIILIKDAHNDKMTIKIVMAIRMIIQHKKKFAKPTSM